MNTLLKIGLAALTIAFQWMFAQAIREPHITAAGDLAPDFSIATDRGSRVGLKDFRGRVLVLNFWASWCVPCIEETPSLVVQRAFGGSRVAVLGISIDRNEPEYPAFLRRFGVDFETA